MSSYHSRPAAYPGAVLWRVAADQGDSELFRVIPDAVMDIVYSNGRLLFAGADTRANFTPSAPGAITWGIRLPPGLAHGLLGVPADELTDQRFELGELTRLPESFSDALNCDPASGLERIVSHLWRRAAPDLPELRLAGSIDRAAQAGASVRATAEQHNLSERTLRRFSDRVFGYGVKSLASIHRLQRALIIGRSGATPAAAAALARYADQAHLSREAKRLTGLSFRVLVAQR